VMSHVGYDMTILPSSQRGKETYQEWII
jgi:hypothetical protein